MHAVFIRFDPFAAKSLHVTDPTFASDKVFGDLTVWAEAGAPAVAFEIDLVTRFGVDNGTGVYFIDMAIIHAGGKADDVTCKAVAANVRGLPNVPGSDLSHEFVSRKPELCAALIVNAVCANKIDRRSDGVMIEANLPFQQLFGTQP